MTPMRIANSSESLKIILLTISGLLNCKDGENGGIPTFKKLILKVSDYTCTCPDELNFYDIYLFFVKLSISNIVLSSRMTLYLAGPIQSNVEQHLKIYLYIKPEILIKCSPGMMVSHQGVKL